MKKLVLGALLLLASTVAVPASAQARPGDVDRGFGSRGLTAVTPTGENPVLRDLIRLEDGSLLAVGGARYAGPGILARFDADGAPDSSFGPGGMRATPDSFWTAAQPLPDGGFLAYGRAGREPAVARFTAGGSLDPSFGESGVRVLPVRDLFVGPSDILIARGPGLDAEGRIVAAVETLGCSASGEGDGKGVQGYDTCGSLALVRLTPDGDLDPAFGDGDGVRIVATGSNVDVAISADGGFILAGSEYLDYGDADVPNEGMRWIRRLGPDGSVDTGFGKNGGLTIFDRVDHGRPTMIDVADDGSITVAYGLYLTRVDARGRPDESYGRLGAAPIDVDWLFRSTRRRLIATSAEMTDRYVYVSGTALSGGKPRAARSAFVLRLTPEGEPDPTFSNDGVAFRQIGHALQSTPARRPVDEGAVLADDRGRVVAATTGGERDGLNFSLVRFQGGTGVRLTCNGVPATVQGTAGDDRLFAGEVTATGPGDDLVKGTGGKVCTGSGDDRFEIGQEGAELVLLGPGRDVARGDADQVNGGPGDDRIVGLVNRTFGGTGDDLIDTRSKHVVYLPFSLNGGAGNDVLLAGPGPSLLRGAAGNDILRGGPGEDRLFGGPGDDRLFGEQGADFLSGGPGRDRLRGGDDGPDYRRFGISGRRVRGHVDLLPGRIARGHVRVKGNCAYEGGKRTTEWTQSIGRGMKIKRGRVKDDFDWEAWGDFGYGGTRAKVKSGSIEVRYWETWGFQGTIAPSYKCRTGNAHFTLKRRPAPKQILRQ